MPRGLEILLGLLGSVLSGCLVGPDYERPLVVSPADWRFQEPEARSVANTLWWEQFEDSILNSLIGIAIQENLDVRIAAARIEEFRGRYQVTRSGLFPSLSAVGSAGQERMTSAGAIPLGGVSGFKNPAYDFQAGISASWEVDLWGKIRRSMEAARAEFLATEEARRGVLLSLVCSVAGAYVGLRDLDRRLEIARATFRSREATFRLFERQFREGFISNLELYQAKSELEDAAATIPSLESAVGQQENLLSVLLGRNPEAIPRGKPIEALRLPAVPAGLPSELLENRPDLRQAEDSLVAANARIGVARAQFYPSISLTGTFGVESISLRNLFSGPARAWTYALQAAQPLFTGGSLSGGLQVAESVRTEALIEYLKAIQQAFREVEDSLIDQRTSRAQVEALQRELEAVRRYAEVARQRYNNGYTSYIEVLDAERSRFSVELRLSQARGFLLQALVNLYKAMGGGWVAEAEKRTDLPVPRH